MTRRLRLAMALVAALLCVSSVMGQTPRFRALVLYSTTVEPDHVQFAQDALKFLSSIAAKDQFQMDASRNWDDLNEASLEKYQLVIWLNESPTKLAQRAAFQNYMEHGGAWLGFHAAGYNDKDTGWPWYVEFLGGAVFSINSWPPLPAKLVIGERESPVTAGLPDSYIAPSNEWYVWKPSPRLNPAVRVLVSLAPSNYPLGLKDVLLAGDCPVVWTNTKYKMVYMNMGHGGKILSNATQNRLIENAVRWLGGGAVGAKEIEPVGMRVNPQAVAVNPKTKKVYAVNTEAGTVTVVSGASHAAKTVKVGRQPSTIGINPVTNRIYVANAEDGTVSVVDGSVDQVVATVKVGELPYVMAVNSASNKVYVAKTFSNTTTMIDGTTNQARILNTGVQASAMASSAALNKTYLINLDNTVTVLDGATDESSKIRAGSRDWGLALNPATDKTYVGDSEGSTLTIIDGKRGSVRGVQAGEIPSAIAVDAEANRVYVADYGSDSVTVVDGENDAVIATIPVEAHPQALAADSAAHIVYVANTGSHSVSVISGTSNSVVGRVDVGSGPYAVAAANGLAYVKCLGRDEVFAINPRTLTVSAVTAAVSPHLTEQMVPH